MTLPSASTPVDLKHRLRDLETDCCDRLHDLAAANGGALKAPTSMDSRAGRGAVHRINSGIQTRVTS
jgi:hypothetical protein